MLESQSHHLESDELEKIGEMTDGYSGADMSCLCRYFRKNMYFGDFFFGSCLCPKIRILGCRNDRKMNLSVVHFVRCTGYYFTSRKIDNL